MERTKCPDCGRRLVERRRRRDGRYFLGCSGYPKCHYSRNWERLNWSTLDDFNAEWRVKERTKRQQLKKAKDIHCPRCNIGLLEIYFNVVECNQTLCDYKEDYKVRTNDPVTWEIELFNKYGRDKVA